MTPPGRLGGQDPGTMPDGFSVLPSVASLPELSATDTASPPDVVVIGAGIVGLSIAQLLSNSGRRVLVLDRQGVAAEASRGNAGAFAFSDIFPLASPGILRKAPRWLLDPLGPLSIAPAYLPRIAPWLFHFWRASFPERVKASAAAQAGLMDLSITETDAMLAELQALDTQAERLRAAGLPLAAERVALATAAYQAGRGDLAAVLTARSQVLETQLRAIDLDAQRATLRLRLSTLIAE